MTPPDTNAFLAAVIGLGHLGALFGVLIWKLDRRQ